MVYIRTHETKQRGPGLQSITRTDPVTWISVGDRFRRSPVRRSPADPHVEYQGIGNAERYLRGDRGVVGVVRPAVRSASNQRRARDDDEPCVPAFAEHGHTPPPDNGAGLHQTRNGSDRGLSSARAS
jgi:hypothetical protein